MIKTLHIVFCLWCCTALQADAQLPHIQTITVADGLSQGFITTMLQDSRGFMWFGTLDGLNRYDGYSIRRYNYRPFDPFSLTGSAYITQILESGDGLLWIGTDECLYVFDPATERFFNINQQVKILPRASISQIAIDNMGTLIVHLPNQDDPIGLYRIRVPAGFDLQLRSGTAPLAGISVEHLSLPSDAVPPRSRHRRLHLIRLASTAPGVARSDGPAWQPDPYPSPVTGDCPCRRRSTTPPP